MKAAIYCRVSSSDQVEKGLSIPAQQAALREYAKRNNMEIVAEYIDEGESAYKKRGERTQFKAMISDAKRKPRPFDIILVHKWDRFARNREDSIVYKSILRKQCGIELISISEPIENGPVGKLMEGILEILAEFYSDNLALEVKKGMIEAAKSAKALGIPPTGYMIENGKLVPHPQEAPVIRFIFDEYIKGTPTSRIKYLIYEQADKFGNWVLERKWESPNLAHILTKPIYKGQYKWGDIVIDNAVEPIVPEEIFDLAQKMRKDRTRPRSDTYDYLLRGLIRCAGCGRFMSLWVTRNKKKHICDMRIKCGRHSNYHDCSNNSISLKKITERVLEDMKKFAGDPRLSEDVEVEFKENKVIEDKRSEILKELDSMENKFNRLLIAYQNGVIDLERLKVEKTTMEDRKIELQKILHQLNEALKWDITPKIKEEIQHKIMQVLQIIENEELLLDERKKALRSIVKEVIWSRENKSLKIHYTL